MKRLVAMLLMVAFALTIFPINEAAALPLADSAEGTSAISEGILGKEADATRSMGVQNESRTVIGITVDRQPKLIYTVGEELDLASYDDLGNFIYENLLVSLHYSDDSTIGPIEYSDFAYMGISTEPAHGTILTAEDDGRKVEVICNDCWVETEPLQVTEFPAEGADFLPAKADFDKNPIYQADVSTQIQWRHNILSITDVKNEQVSLGSENYSVTQDSGKYYLNIKKEYLAAQPVGELVLTVEFSAGPQASLIINIQDTTVIDPPSWPAGSTLTATQLTYKSVKLSWTPAQDDLGVTGYKIYQDDTLVETVAGTVNEIAISDLAPSTSYRFQVQAGDADGQWTTDGPSLTVKTLSFHPSWPEGSTLTATDITANSVVLMWTPAEGATQYKLYLDGKETSHPFPDTSVFFAGLQPSTRYVFQVQAGNADGQWTTDGPSLTVETLAKPLIDPPSWPPGSKLTATLLTDESVKLSWTPAQDNLEVTGYKIYQNDVLVATVAGTVNEFVISDLASSTSYRFQVQAGDAEEQWTTDGPSVIFTTGSSAEALQLELKAPRKNIKGSLYMGDTVKIEMLATESGLQPEVTLIYREWNSERTNIEERQQLLTLSETAVGSKKYTADFILREGIWEIVSLEAQLPGSPALTAEINRRVAGRLKVNVQLSAEMDLASSLVSVSSARGGGTFTGQLSGGHFIVEGLDMSDDYILQHFDANRKLLYQSQAIDIKGGLEQELSYEISAPADVKVRVIDDDTGLPIKNVMVIGKTTRTNNTLVTRYATTFENGYAVVEAPYFISNALKGSAIEFTTIHESQESDGSDWYQDGYLNTVIPSTGENEFEIRLKKAPMVTLTGTVRNQSGATIPGANIHLGTMVYKDGTTIIRLSLYTRTDQEGKYTLELAKIPGEIEIACYANDMEKHETIVLQEGVNNLDITLPPYVKPTVKVNMDTQDLSGNIGKLVVHAVEEGISLIGRTQLKVTNLSTGATSFSNDGRGYFFISGQPGDIVEVSADGKNYGLGKGSATAVINEDNYAEVTVLLTERGSVRAKVLDSNGGERIGEKRYLYTYQADNGQYVSKAESTAPYIASSLPEGTYNIVLSWDNMGGMYYSNWLNNLNCIKIENIQVKDGEIIDLGLKELKYNKSNLFFRYNGPSSITANKPAALPGSIVTLRVVYDYDKMGMVSPGQLDLVAQIPAGTTYVDNTAMNRTTRGNLTVNPVVDQEAGTITLDLKECLEGAAGTLTYQVKINSPARLESIWAGAELRFVAGGNPRSEMFATCQIPAKMITLDSPLDIDQDLMNKPIEFSGLAPANHKVELYDGNIKIGETQASPSGQWSASLVLPNMGAPIFHHLSAITEVEGVQYSAKDLVLVGVAGVKMTEFTLKQGLNSIKIPLNNTGGSVIFPFALNGQGDFLASVAFDNNDKVKQVKIAGCPATRRGNEFQAVIPFAVYTSNELIVEYQEILVEPDDISKYYRLLPASLKDAQAAFTDPGTTSEDVYIEYDTDGYINALDIPEFRVTMPEGSLTASMKVELADFDVREANNYTNLGKGLYGYDFSYELIDGKYRITAYLDRRLLPQAAGNQERMFTPMAAAAIKGLGTVKTVLDIGGDINDLKGAAGDLATTGKMIELLNKYENVRPNLESHLQEYYDRQIAMMGEDILMGKSLGYIGSTVAEAGNLVPLLGQVVIGVAELISGELLGNMFDNEFQSDYNRLMAEMRLLPGGQEDYYENYQEPYADYHPEPMDSYWYWYWYVYQRDKWIDVGHDDLWRYRDRPFIPHWVYDPSGFVYEGVEDNRIQGVTATALFLPASAAQNAAEAKASQDWQFWDASWYLQENPQTTDAEGRYAWDVPTGWWMVQYVKDGYQTAYSDALPVPPPQLDVNIPLVRLESPAVEKTVWGSGGRYVDVYFSKYMDIRSLEAANSISLTDNEGSPVSGKIEFPMAPKTGVNNLSLTKVARFAADVPMTAGGQYKLTVNQAVADYAGFSMTADYSETGTIPPGAPIASLTGIDITVEPGLDITQDVMDALVFTPVNPEDQGILDKSVQLLSSRPDVVKIRDDGKVLSLSQGVAQITATSMDDKTKSATFTVSVAYPSAPVSVAQMVILDQNGKVLSELSIKKGDTYALQPEILPADASNKKMSYSSDNPAVAYVDQTGKIQGLEEGLAYIIARTEDQNITQRILVRVLPASTGGSKGSSSSREKEDVVLPPETPGYELPFVDVQKSDWFYDALLYIAEKGIAKGVSQQEYAPNKTVSRAEFITMLCRAFGIEERSGENYSDAGNSWYTGFLAAAKQLGLAQGVGDNRFEPDRAITREEMVVIIYNYFKNTGQIAGSSDSESVNYADRSQVSNWALEAVAYASAHAWIKGKGNNIFDPQGIATRAELAQILYNILKE